MGINFWECRKHFTIFSTKWRLNCHVNEFQETGAASKSWPTMSNYALSFKNPIADLTSQEVDRVSIPLREMNSSGKNLYFSLQLVKFQLSFIDMLQCFYKSHIGTTVLSFSWGIHEGQISNAFFSHGVSFLARANNDNRKNAPEAAVLLHCCGHAWNRNHPPMLIKHTELPCDF